ncbi:hypothetical protein [uncultured Cyclobacterium sp.]|uniref:hypothetical protein n=1 Tax=uncultured Cyclobacterium sp. TaxID=453820 RepID=UPI0030EBBFE5|tara:strand:- start:3213 stop:3791 length:579 start_codon:yes stop_codon:yes gene_type:complete
MKNKILFIWLSISTICFVGFAQSDQKPLVAHLLVEGGIEYGGDEILEVYFTNGETQTMRLGQGAYIGLGGQFNPFKTDKIFFRTLIGIKYNTTAAENANIRLTRLPLNLIGYYRIANDFRLGIGGTSHFNVKLKGDGFIPDVAFTSGLGSRFEFGYKAIALTYTNLKYKDLAKVNYSASSLGLSASIIFPNK